MRPVCRHCHRRAVHRPRGLCFRCYGTPAVHAAYFPARAPRVTDVVDPKTPAPTNHAPGTPEKMAVLAARAAAGEHLFHPRDRVVED